jgi:hypothetical protein
MARRVLRKLESALLIAVALYLGVTQLYAQSTQTLSSEKLQGATCGDDTQAKKQLRGTTNADRVAAAKRAAAKRAADAKILTSPQNSNTTITNSTVSAPETPEGGAK